MDMYVRFYVAVCMLLLLSQTSSSVPKKQSTKVKLGDHPYLALVNCGNSPGQECAASILSDSKVLSSCACADAETTTVYAGLIQKGDANAQKRTVQLVDSHPNKTDLKIFTVEKWDFTNDVSAVNFNGKRRTSTKDCKAVGFGATDGKVRVIDKQTIGSTECGQTGTKGVLYANTTKDVNQQLQPLDKGGPALCGNQQRGINVEYKAMTVQRDDVDCNVYINIADYSDWILGKIEDSSTGNSTNTNGTTGVSSADCIYHQFKKNSKWRVGLMILLTAKLFLQ